MSVSVSQGIVARYTVGKFAELHYVVRGAIDEVEAGSELYNESDASYGGLPRRDVEIETEHVENGNSQSNIFKGTVRYYWNVADESTVVSFDTTGGTQKITQSLSTVAAYPAGSPNFQGAINYDGENVNGVDIGIGAYEWAEQKHKTNFEVDDDYRKLLSDMSYTVNSNTFRKYPAGEVLFKGAHGTQVIINGQKKWQITYTFARSPNMSNFYVGSIHVSQKYGWDYLWTLYGESINANRVIKVPVAVYVERIYRFEPFSQLEI
ncbi:MAG: hypothetical protein PHH26_05540 [Candidatus Thermoplasmatota archaeon]|nr:hypothetical protein [Candidatus Thermoplasmatota archaeon]